MVQGKYQPPNWTHNKSVLKVQPVQIKGAIVVDIQTKYGTERIYPICENGKLFLKLLGEDVKTLSRKQIEIVKALGFDIQVKQVTL